MCKSLPLSSKFVCPEFIKKLCSGLWSGLVRPQHDKNMHPKLPSTFLCRSHNRFLRAQMPHRYWSIRRQCVKILRCQLSQLHWTSYKRFCYHLRGQQHQDMCKAMPILSVVVWFQLYKRLCWGLSFRNFWRQWYKTVFGQVFLERDFQQPAKVHLGRQCDRILYQIMHEGVICRQQDSQLCLKLQLRYI